jgi:protein TonB
VNLIGNNTSGYLKGNKRGKRSILPFIALSILFHLLLVLLYLLLYPPDRQAVKPKEKPEFIEITQVPIPKEKETEPPEETKRLAERSHQAPEEKTKDDFTKEGAVSTLPQPKQPGQAKKTEEKTQPSKQSKEVKTAKKEPKKEVSTDKSRQVASIPKVEKDSELARKRLEERKTPDLSKEDLFSALPRQYSQQQQETQEFLGARNIEKKEDTVDFNTTEFKYISYFNKLKRQIEGVWNYPELSRLRGEQGELFLIFTIRRDGQLEDVKLINSSGYARLDDEAIRAIDVAAPFPPFPSQWGSLERLNVRAVFRYQISYGWQIR